MIRRRHGAAVDFYYQSLADANDYQDTEEYIDRLTAAQEKGASIPIDLHCESRDGMFDADQHYAVWDPEDVEQLIARLIRARLDAVAETGEA